MDKRTWTGPLGIASLICFAMAAPAQTFTTLASFDGMNGANPTYMSLVQGLDGGLYGTTTKGGAYGLGTAFKVTPTGLTTIYSFSTAIGSLPIGSLLLATDGNFYGTTEAGGSVTGPSTGGTAYRLTPAGVLTTIYSFAGAPGGSNPNAGLIQGTNGDFYGTTLYRGYGGSGTAFQLTPAGVLTLLHSFAWLQGPPNGAFPSAPLLQASDGNLYGTTIAGGTAPNGGDGEVFKIVLTGPNTGESLVVTFVGANGASPYAPVIQGSDGYLYGTTSAGGSNGLGTVFRTTPEGDLTTIYNFNAADGTNPYGGVIQATDGNLYGTTTSGGDHGYGTLYQLTVDGTLRILHSFSSTDGAAPNGSLMQATNGNFYGATSSGGAHGDGTVFKLSVGLTPFVMAVPTSGIAGATITILGTDLTGTTSVTFNGTPAKFQVVSATEITATVPGGATTGAIKVSTPGGPLLSNVFFRVRH